MSEFKSSDRIRRAKHEKNYTTILNATIQDSRLSWKARGLHHYILSLPNDWHICVAHLAEQSEPDGEAIIKSALKELEVNGYITKTRLKDERGRFLKCVWDIYESPQVDFQPVAKVTKRKASKQSPQVDFPQVDKPQVDKPQVDKPQVENHALISTNKQSTYLPSTEEASTEEENTRSENIYTAPPENFPESDLPTNQVLIDCMADRKETPIPPTPFSPSPENVGLAIAAKPKATSLEAKRNKYQVFLDVWLQEKPDDWVDHKTLSKTAISKLETFVKTHGNESMAIFQKSLWYAKNDNYHKKVLKGWTLEQYLSNEKPYQYYEKYEQAPKKESAHGDSLMSNDEIKRARIFVELQQAMGIAS